MKIGEAKPIYYANRKELVDQMRSLSKQSANKKSSKKLMNFENFIQVEFQTSK
ncbi:MAG: hypothetical protein J5476_10185 [Lachnospiraceae bacterium]|nr:hypothetical protein [Lachnospiraceae bacterium]